MVSNFILARNVIEKVNGILVRQPQSAWRYMIELCAIVRDENEYLKEWIVHHLAIGFDEIILYDNGSQVSPAEVVKELPFAMGLRVQVWRWKPEHAQIQCYNHHARQSDENWCAFIDIDEFIILKKHGSMKEYLA